MNWAQKVYLAIKDLGREKTDLRTMLDEWSYTGNTFDLEAPVESCQLCSQPKIRYQFEIKNRFTEATLLVGSECITKFDLSSIGNEGEILDSEITKKRVAKDRSALIKDAREKRILNCLLLLKQIEDKNEIKNRFEIDSSINKYKERKGFSPKHLATLLWRFERAQIQINLKDFKVILKRNREKEQIRTMEDWWFGKLLPVLTVAQKELCMKIRKNKN